LRKKACNHSLSHVVSRARTGPFCPAIHWLKPESCSVFKFCDLKVLQASAFPDVEHNTQPRSGKTLCNDIMCRGMLDAGLSSFNGITFHTSG
jgi:hypothetical protein